MGPAHVGLQARVEEYRKRAKAMDFTVEQFALQIVKEAETASPVAKPGQAVQRWIDEYRKRPETSPQSKLVSRGCEDAAPLVKVEPKLIATSTESGAPTKKRRMSLDEVVERYLQEKVPAMQPKGGAELGEQPLRMPNAPVLGDMQVVQPHVGQSMTRNYKTQLCRNWGASKVCHLGSQCSFAHGEEELQVCMGSTVVVTGRHPG